MAGVSLAALMPAVNFSTTTLAVLAVGVALVSVYTVIKASQFVIAMASGRHFYGGRSWDREEYEAGLLVVKAAIRRGDVVDKSSRDALAFYEGSRSKRKARF